MSKAERILLDALEIVLQALRDYYKRDLYLGEKAAAEGAVGLSNGRHSMEIAMRALVRMDFVPSVSGDDIQLSRRKTA